MPLPVQDRAGQTYCYNCVIETHQPQDSNLARRMLSDWSLAEDAVQKSFVSGYRAFSQFRGEGLKAGVMRILANSCRDMLRSRLARLAISLDSTPTDSEDSAPSAIDLLSGLPLRAPGWAYAGAESVAGLALAIMVSADTIRALAPSRLEAISIQSSEIAAQSLPDSDAPQAGLSSTRATSQPQIAAAEPRVRVQPEIAAAPESDSVLALRAAEAVPNEVPGAASSSSGAIADSASALYGLTATTAPQDTKVDASVLSENPDNQPAELADQAIVGVAKAEPKPVAAPTLDRYQGTPILWRELEGIAAALLLSLLSILVIKQLMSRRMGGRPSGIFSAVVPS